jgi:molybdate transport repressor ModE-like protein
MTPLNALTFKQLRALEAVAQYGSISSAAESLALTPPAVHSQLKALDETFGCAMLTRNKHGTFEATAEGAILLAAFQKVSAALEKAVQTIDSLKRGLAGTVILGVVSTGKYFAPSVVASLKKTFPDIEVVLQIGNRDSIISALDAGRIDLAIMGRPPRQPGVEAYSIGDHPHVLIASPDHPLTKVSEASAEQVLAEHFLMREQGSGTRILAMRFLDQFGEGQPFTYTEMDSNETIKQAAIAGLGIALISIHTAAEELKSGRLALIHARNLPIVRQWFVLHRADEKPTGAAERILTAIRDQSRHLLHLDEIREILKS